jgi:mRNA interferase RelE/StbE
MKIFYTHRAAEELKSLPKEVQKRIVTKMRFYANQEDPLAFAKRLVDVREGQFRFRIGDYRVVFDVAKDSIYVLKIGKRSEIYE